MFQLSNILRISLIFTLSLPAYAADLEKETRLKNQIIDYILDGDAVFLKAGNHEFLTIYTESEHEQPGGGVIIMHGRGYHPNWPEIVYPLRTGLPEHGWHTLAIQMPVLDNASTFYDYLEIMPESFPRISAAVEYLQQQGVNNIVLIAHSCSVHMSIAWLEQNPQVNLYAYIGIGMGSTDKGQPMLQPFPLEKFTLPILDIRGEHDYPAVHGKAADRWRRMQLAGNSMSRQLVVPAADHYFTDKGDVLLKQVAAWLASLEKN